MTNSNVNNEDETVRCWEKKLTFFLGPYETVIMKLQSLLVWENPFRSAILFTLFHIIFWLICTTSSRFFFLLSVFVMCTVCIDTWKNKIWPEIRVPPTEPEDSDGWTPIHPRLLSVPEISRHLSHSINIVVTFFKSARQYRTSHPLVFCLGNTAFFTLTALIGYYISGFLLLYGTLISLMLWPSMLYHSMLRKVCSLLEPGFIWIKGHFSKASRTVITFSRRIHDFRTKLSKLAPATETVEDEDFVPQVNPDISEALAKAITDSEDEGGNSSIPTPRLSKNPSFSTSEDEAPEVDFDLNINQMPSFDDLDNTDDELGLPNENSNNVSHNKRGLHFTTSHFKESDSEDEESLDFSDTAPLSGTTKSSSGPQFELASTLARTITSMIESAMIGVGALDDGQSASSSSLNPRTGSKITYTRTEKGESIDFLNPEPSISESDEDMDEEESQHIAEIEKDFDFLSELDPEHED
ncbi:reticulophagy regulator 3-like isoform X1 [Biomphalaria glabrata]|uniref:Reticulophagy regulator 3-like isoform X1 n=2 Tax=Biomphalaria glabrata TaxID=6526 RepID=A0A9U8E3H7_BIOGL|nr:reticulophagy regulator 3-like isoform X1 [Biomphalaria glabrata]